MNRVDNMVVKNKKVDNCKNISNVQMYSTVQNGDAIRVNSEPFVFFCYLVQLGGNKNAYDHLARLCLILHKILFITASIVAWVTVSHNVTFPLILKYDPSSGNLEYCGTSAPSDMIVIKEKGKIRQGVKKWKQNKVVIYCFQYIIR